MRRILLSFLNVMMVCAMTFFASCSKDSDVEAPTPEPEVPVAPQPPTYTVMLYGCGGGNLDEYMDFNLNQVAGYGKQSKVNFTALVKYSVPYQGEEGKEGTRLLTLTEDGMKNEKKYEASYRLDNPEHLANFIKESKEKMPADKYILIIWNHGQEFGFCDKFVESSYPEGESESRAVVFDDNTDTALSIYELEKGIKDSGVKLDLLYFDACLMGMAETYYQLKDCSKYIMAASHITSGYGGNYTQLMIDLQENDSLTDAIKQYVPATVKNWENAGESSCDLECYDMQYMDELAQHMKTASTALVNLKEKEIDAPAGLDDFDEREDRRVGWYAWVQFDWNLGGVPYIFSNMNVSVDLCSALTRLSKVYQNSNLLSAATLVKQTVSKMTVAAASCGLPQWLDGVSMGITWPTDDFVDRLKTLEKYPERLRKSAFCQATGWDKFLLDTEYPVISVVPSVYSSGFYEGETSSYQYTWDVSASIDESGMPSENVEAAQQILADLTKTFCEDIAGYTYPVRHARGIAWELNLVVSSWGKDQLTSLGVKKIKIHVQLKDGESIDPNDPDAEKYPATVDQEYELD